MQFLHEFGSILWGPWTSYILLGSGILFTLWIPLRIFQQTRSYSRALLSSPPINAMTHGVQVVRGVYDDPEDPGAINHFQALAAALSATVGLGNIGGVALAIAAGGPGAIFWMWLVGLFGMALKTAEITLTMLYRNTEDPDNPHGGAMWVVDGVLGAKGGGWKIFARFAGVFFCITLLISSFTGGNMFQSWNVANLTHGYFGVPRVGTGILLAVLVGLVIVGGIKRIGNVAGRLVPVMCLLYLLAALAVVGANLADIPGLFVLIVKSAFAPTEAGGAFLGGAMGWAFSQGMRRAIFSNEAGQGSAPIAHAAAKTDEPAREGIVGGMGPFIDTICICTLTAMVILSTGTWNRDAIGDYGATIQLVQDDTAAVPTWRVEGAEDVSLLPQSRFAEWTEGSSLFMIAEVEGAIHGDTAHGRISVEGTLVDRGTGSVDAPAVLEIEWSAVEFDPDSWNGSPTALSLVSQGIWRNYAGANLTGLAFDRQFPGLGKWLVTFAAWLFALSTMISWSYYGEQGMIYMLGERSVIWYKLVFLMGIIYAAVAIQDTADMEVLMDLGTGTMLWSNLPIVLGLSVLTIRALSDYHVRLFKGEIRPHAAPSITDVVEGKDVE